MTERYDGSTIDLEQALVRYMVEHRLSRRDLLERIARVGAAAALAPIIAACTGGGASPSPSVAAAPSSGAPPSTGPSATPAPTPIPEPEAELFIYNWTDYIGENTIPSFEDKYNVKVTYDFFANTEEAYAKLGEDGGGYDLSFPISVDIPAFVAKNALVPLDKSLIPNIVNLGEEWANPGYDPGNTHSVPYMWWTTGVGYDSTKVTDSPTSSKALWDPRYSKHISMLDDYQEAFAMALIQLGYSANTTDTAQMDEALALLAAAEAARPRVQHRHDRHAQLRRRVDRPDLGRRHVRDPGRERERRCSTSPRRARSGARTRSRSSRARSTRSPRTCSSTTCSTPR